MSDKSLNGFMKEAMTDKDWDEFLSKAVKNESIYFAEFYGSSFRILKLKVLSRCGKLLACARPEGSAQVINSDMCVGLTEEDAAAKANTLAKKKAE